MDTFDASRPSFAPYGLTCVRWQPTRMPRADRHDEIELNLLRSGRITYLHGGRKVPVTANRLCAFWAALPHQIIDYQDVTEFYVATVPLAWFMSWRPPPCLVRQLLRGDMVQERETSGSEGDLVLFRRWLNDLEQGTDIRTRAVLLEMEARLLRLSVACQDHADARQASRSMDKVSAMATFIAEHYAQPITAADISAAVALHPNYAATLFRNVFGMTMVDYLTKLRLSHAQLMLVTTPEKILEIAFSSGFSSISRFNAAFRSGSGLTPRDYRARYRLRSAGQR